VCVCLPSPQGVALHRYCPGQLACPFCPEGTCKEEPFVPGCSERFPVTQACKQVAKSAAGPRQVRPQTRCPGDLGSAGPSRCHCHSQLSRGGRAGTGAGCPLGAAVGATTIPRLPCPPEYLHAEVSEMYQCSKDDRAAFPKLDPLVLAQLPDFRRTARL
jgi:hypothetical protein